MKKALNIAKIKAEKVFDYFRQSPHKNKYQVGGVFAIAMIALLIFQSFLFPLNSRAASASWNFSNSGDYTYDNTKVNIAGNQASLKATSAYATDGTGGTITHSGGYTIHTFSAGGTFTPPTGLTSVAALVVAGGGSGGNGRAGGGGAGGLISNSSFAVSTQAYTITVGDGGTSGNNGGNSVFSSLTAIGGGKGNAIGGNGSSGGSGGGAGVNYSGVTPTGGAGTSGQGNVGGNSYGVADNPRNSGGGGGAGSAGVSGALRPDGGTGLANSISGSSVFYAAGGGGGWGGSDRTNYGSGVGGSGIGGNGGSASPNANGTNGTNNTGSGGGGGGDGSGGLGGSGVVIIRYLSVTYPTTHAPGNDWIATDTGHDWSYRKAITISKTNVGSTLTNFPAKIEISADTDIGAHAKSDLTDLRFTSSGGTTILPAERETGAVTAGSASGIFWVQVPSISSSADTIIYAYYGNSSASAQASPSGVWDSNFKGVWHLKETGTNPTVNDSTSNANNSTSQTWTPTSNGQIDGAASMDATQNISMGDVLNFGTGDRTFSLWMKPPNSNQISAILSKRNPTNPYQQYTLGVGYTDSGGIGIASKKFGMFFHDGLGLTNTHCADYYTTNDVVDGNWHHVSLTWSSGVPKIYVDGVSQTLTTVYSGTSVNTDTTAPFLIGNNLYSGLLDQIAVSNSARSADWIKFEYYNQKDAAGQLSYGSQDGFFGYTTANSTAQNYVSVSGFSATTSGTGTTVFQVSPDGGTTWYWYNGSAWAATTNGSWEANTAATINTHFADASFNTYGATIKSFKFRSFFTSDGTQNSILSAVGLTYVLDTAAPAQPAAVVASSQSSGGVTLTDNTWYNYSAPYFSWTASVDQANSGEVATGTAGYYVYFGTNASADPSSYQTGVTYQSSSLTLNNTYYLRLKAKDNAGNISSAWTEFTYKYDQDNEPPQDPAVLTAKKASNGDAITTNNFYNAANPYFSWTPSVDQADTGSGYAHTVTGTAGYYVYFGTDVTAIPCSAGSYQTPANFTSVATLVSGSTYYLRLQPKDNAGNVTMNPASSQTCTNSNVWAPFIYKYDDTAPNSPSYVSVSPSGYSRTNTHTFSWPVSGGDGPSDSSGSGLSKYQYKLGDGDWTDVGGDTTTATISPTNPAYRTGANVFYLRAVDDVGNVDASPSQVTFYYNNSSPTAPTSLTVDPSTSANNSFAFSWSLPLTYGGAIAGYYYSINALPTIVNSTFSSSTSLAAGPYASQQGQNTFYIVAKDNAGNVDFDSCNSIFGNPTTDGCSKVNFTANTSAPGIPTGLQAIDSSNRDAAEYSDVLKWVAPVSQGTGFAGYTVERSTDGLNYSQVATTTGTSYVDDNLSSQLYYYRLRSHDNAGQYSSYSSVVFITPTGRYTQPPAIVTPPTSSTKAFSSTINWTTDREASTIIKYGTDSNYLNQESSHATEMVKSHEITVLGLTPETTYYYKALWIDSDGNIGTTDSLNFQTGLRPKISEVKVSNIGLTATTISWTSTTISTSTINFGKSTSYGGSVTDRSGSQTTSHTMNLDGLDDSSTYHFQIVGNDTDGNILASDDYSFNTLVRPLISNLRFQPVPEATTTLQFSFTTNVPTTTIISYGQGSEATKTKSDSKYLTDHSITVSGLLDKSTYSFSASAVDEHGNTANSDRTTYTTPEDSRPPKISNLSVEVKSQGFGSSQKAQLVVSWQTDEPATGQIEYSQGISGTDYSNKTKEDAAFSTTHAVIVSELEPSKIYHLRASSADHAGNRGVSDSTTTITGKVQQSIVDIILNSLQRSIGWLFNLNFGIK